MQTYKQGCHSGACCCCSVRCRVAVCAVPGKIVAAAAQPVAEAAQRLQWDGDAAFELLGKRLLLGRPPFAQCVIAGACLTGAGVAEATRSQVGLHLCLLQQ
jgi:hypothetical protein